MAVGDALCVCEIVGEILDDLVVVSVGLCVWLLDCVELGDDVVVRDWDCVGVWVFEGEHAVFRPIRRMPAKSVSTANVEPLFVETTANVGSAKPLSGTSCSATLYQSTPTLVLQATT